MRWPWQDTNKLKQLDEELSNQRRLIVALQNKNNEQQAQIDMLLHTSGIAIQSLELIRGHLALIDLDHGYEVTVPVVKV